MRYLSHASWRLVIMLAACGLVRRRRRAKTWRDKVVDACTNITQDSTAKNGRCRSIRIRIHMEHVSPQSKARRTRVQGRVWVVAGVESPVLFGDGSLGGLGKPRSTSCLLVLPRYRVLHVSNRRAPRRRYANPGERVHSPNQLIRLGADTAEGEGGGLRAIDSQKCKLYYMYSPLIHRAISMTLRLGKYLLEAFNSTRVVTGG